MEEQRLTCIILNSGEVTYHFIPNHEIRSFKGTPTYSVHRMSDNEGISHFSIKREDTTIADCYCARISGALADGMWREIREQRSRWQNRFGNTGLPDQVNVPWVAIFLTPNAYSGDTLEITNLVYREADLYVSGFIACPCGNVIDMTDYRVVYTMPVCDECSKKTKGMTEVEFRRYLYSLAFSGETSNDIS